MDNKNLGIVAIIITVLLCGIPGLASLCLGALVAIGRPIFDDNRYDLPFILGLLCMGVIFIAIPVVVGLLTLRNRDPKKPTFSPDEPLPPPS